MAKKPKPCKSEIIQADKENYNKIISQEIDDYEDYIKRELQEFKAYQINIEGNGLCRRLMRDVEFALWSHEKCDKLHLATEVESAQHKKIVKSLRESVDGIYSIIGNIFPNNEDNGSFSQLVILLGNINQLFFDAMLLGDYKRIIDPYSDKLAHHRKQRQRGKQSAVSRARKAEETWHKLALELAKRSRTENARGSLDYVASYVTENWSNKKFSCPGHSRLKQVIGLWIKEKKLPDKSGQ